MPETAALPGASWTNSATLPKPVEPPIPKPTPLKMRFPLPATSNGTLTMPTVSKTADWDSSLSPTLPHAPTPQLPAAPAAPYHAPTPYTPAHIPQISRPIPTAPQIQTPPTPATPTATPPAYQEPSLWSTARNAGTNVAAQAATGRTVSQLLPRAAGASSLLFAAPTYAAMELGDAAGIYSTDQMKNHLGNAHFWRRPVVGADGEISRDAEGAPRLQSGFNPAAFGWNQRGFDRATTPDGTIVGGMSTGHEALDNAGSYASSAFNAWNPLQGANTLSRTALQEANPLFDLANSQRRQAWGDVLTRPGGAQNTNGRSIPLILANSLVSDPNQPAPNFQPGGALFENGARPYREQNRYHPTYNPTGTRFRPRNQFLPEWMTR